MTDPPRYPHTDDDTGAEPDQRATTGLAPWQKVVGIIGLLVVLAFVIWFLIGGGIEHGPGLHA